MVVHQSIPGEEGRRGHEEEYREEMVEETCKGGIKSHILYIYDL